MCLESRNNSCQRGDQEGRSTVYHYLGHEKRRDSYLAQTSQSKVVSEPGLGKRTARWLIGRVSPAALPAPCCQNWATLHPCNIKPAICSGVSFRPLLT